MSLDGIVLRSLCKELKDNLINGKIDKIHQPESDEIILNIRNNGKNYKLLLSSNSNHPRVSLSNISKANPEKAPMFCMLLRKHIQNGKIMNISQVSLDRIISIQIESHDDFYNKVKKSLIVEIMGKHSNIILSNYESNEILGTIKKVPYNIDSLRVLSTGSIYNLPPNSKKTIPFSIDYEEFKELLIENNLPIFKSLYNTFLGLSPLVSKEILFRAQIDIDSIFSNLDDKSQYDLYNSFKDLYMNIENNIFYPNIVSKDNIPIYFSSIRLTQFQNMDFIDNKLDSPSEMIETYYSLKDNSDRVSQKSSELKKFTTVKIDRLKSKLAKLEVELNNSKNREIYKLQADILNANIYKVIPGSPYIILENFYTETLEDIKINLNIKLNPAQNVQRLYKKYSKLKNAEKLLLEQIELSKSELKYLESILFLIESSSNTNEVDEIKEELISEGYFKKQKSKQKNKKKIKVSKPFIYKSSDGFDIFVGRNNKQNDDLTLKQADRNDFWFHTKDIPGSHVIVKSNGASLPDNTILEAANLAAYFSKGSNSSNVPVDYTIRKNVKKPSGAKPGMVIYENNSTIYVNPIAPTVKCITN